MFFFCNSLCHCNKQSLLFRPVSLKGHAEISRVSFSAERRHRVDTQQMNIKPWETKTRSEQKPTWIYCTHKQWRNSLECSLPAGTVTLGQIILCHREPRLRPSGLLQTVEAAGRGPTAACDSLPPRGAARRGDPSLCLPPRMTSWASTAWCASVPAKVPTASAKRRRKVQQDHHRSAFSPAVSRQIKQHFISTSCIFFPLLCQMTVQSLPPQSHYCASFLFESFLSRQEMHCSFTLIIYRCFVHNV